MKSEENMFEREMDIHEVVSHPANVSYRGFSSKEYIASYLVIGNQNRHQWKTIYQKKNYGPLIFLIMDKKKKKVALLIEKNCRWFFFAFFLFLGDSVWKFQK